MLLLTAAATLLLLLGFGLSRRRSRRVQIADGGAPVRVRKFIPWVYVAASLALLPGAIDVAGGVGGLFRNRAEVTDLRISQGVTLEQVGGTGVALTGLLPAALAVAALYLFLIRIIPQWRDRGGIGGVPGGDVLGFLVL